MKELIDKIEEAFADVKYPGDDDLTDSIYGDEPAALINNFRGKTNSKQLNSTFLDQAPDGWGTALAFFSANALRFYLPAYLIADIRGELINTDPVYRLNSSSTRSGANNKFAKLDAAQVSAVVAYLWWKLEATGGRDPNIEQALENYWLERDADSQD